MLVGEKMKKVLELKNVSKKLGKKIAVNNVSLEILEGEIFGFVGPNGAGKTTLIKTMLGLYKPTSGEIYIDSHNIKTEFEDALDNVGAIIENPEMYGYLTGRENLNIYARMQKNINKNEIEKIIKLVKLENRIDDKVKTYSLGMRQRLGIAQALVAKPKLLVLDEPTNGLDPLGIKELREMLKHISKEKNIAVFISSHILSEIELMCDKIAIIDNGNLLEIKDIKEFKTNLFRISFKVDNVNKAKEIFEELNPICKDNYILLNLKNEEIPLINKELVKNNINVYEIKKEKKSLEDEFIEKTSGTKGQIK